jgi:hypothetical protein
VPGPSRDALAHEDGDLIVPIAACDWGVRQPSSLRDDRGIAKALQNDLDPLALRGET